ncbi:hypothetical protein [Flavobacterium sp. UMI-01]|uniref:hypothetical protein n=1 Tax=Flavobacterium sp. UMI-01 TaxID=1441053 RepID=UPI001C7D65BC|nr:hypothetical protein [Flavobacterium sp. UMI-01]GIZ07905.1 hypothetical protein FUMI01_06320 [Flavobacterium sp. UMI-01]
MTDHELAEILKYSSPKEIYVFTWNNQLIQLKCPFRVLVLNNVGWLLKGQIVLVTEIKVTSEIKTVYIIEMNAYYYYHFEILI